MTTALLAALSLGVWLYLIVGRGGFWRCAERDDALAPASPENWPAVAAIVPARDEAEVIAQSLGSLLDQDYPGRFSIVLVDDQSSDGTAAIAQNVAESAAASARLTVLRGAEPGPGWTGKLWAMRQGLAHAAAEPGPPEFILFTDADIAYAPDVLRRLVAGAWARDGGLVSLMAKLRCRSPAERLLIPAFIFFFQKLYPFAWVNDPTRDMAAAAGGCMLVNRRALLRAGGLESIRGALIDDCALARLLKSEGLIWLGLTHHVRSLRAYPAFADIRRMVIRSAYAELRFSPWRLAGATLGMGLTYLVPPVLALFTSGWPQFAGIFTYFLTVLAFAPTLRFYGLSRVWGLALPLIAAIYMAFMLDSAVQHWRGRGGYWKGRIQAAPRTKSESLKSDCRV